MTELRRRMIADMQLRGFTPGTQQVYLDAYHSCRNRSCPKCHVDETERWLEH